MGTRNDAAPGKEHRQAALAALRSVPASVMLVFDLELRLVLATGDSLGDAGLPDPPAEGVPLAQLLTARSWSDWQPLFEAATHGRGGSIDVDGVARTRAYRVDVGP